jgi:site-specific DNA-methyltransferase (adenine-specific)
MSKPVKVGNALLHLGDCRDAMAAMPAESIDNIIADAPYGLSDEPDMAEVLKHWLAGDDYKHNSNGFMGNSWDSFVPGPSVWREAMRVLKPGGALLVFFGSRTYDMGVTAIRLAGFEIRDQVSWLYGSGFPKDVNVARAVGRHVCTLPGRHFLTNLPREDRRPDDHICPVSEAGAQFEGEGTALKPAHEPIVWARKPLIGSVAQNVLAYGTGTLNIDAGRIDAADHWMPRGDASGIGEAGAFPAGLSNPGRSGAHDMGRWPANVVIDDSDVILSQFPVVKSGEAAIVRNENPDRHAMGAESRPAGTQCIGYGDEGSAARFFYCAKAGKAEKDAGIAGPEQPVVFFQTANGASGKPSSMSADRNTTRKNPHQTVKPVSLMRWLIRLACRPGSVLLDPFMGSGTTGMAAAYEGVEFIGCDINAEYRDVARQRIAWAQSDAIREAADRAAAERDAALAAHEAALAAAQIDMFAPEAAE